MLKFLTLLSCEGNAREVNCNADPVSGDLVLATNPCASGGGFPVALTREQVDELVVFLRPELAAHLPIRVGDHVTVKEGRNAGLSGEVLEVFERPAGSGPYGPVPATTFATLRLDEPIEGASSYRVGRVATLARTPKETS